MKNLSFTLATFLALTTLSGIIAGDSNLRSSAERKLSRRSFRFSSSSRKGGSSFRKGGSSFRNGGGQGNRGSKPSRPGGKPRGGQALDLRIINEAFEQPFSTFFVMVHTPTVTPLYIRGQPASPQLARLAEDGNATELVQLYRGTPGVYDAFAFSEGAPFLLGEDVTIPVYVPRGFEVTIASMAINTNDCFVSINGMQLNPGMVLDLPGLDAGSEENNEMCNSIPGPLCSMVPGNVRSGNGEGYVHVNRGVAGIGDLNIAADWRNPMLRVVVAARPW